VLYRHRIPRYATDPESRFVTLPGVKAVDFLGWRDFK
jgi:hypothetical protein